MAARILAATAAAQRRCCLSGLCDQPPWHVLVLPQELLLRSFLRLREELRLRAKLWLRKELRLREELWLRTELRLRIELLQFVLLPTSLLLERLCDSLRGMFSCHKSCCCEASCACEQSCGCSSNACGCGCGK